jgi:hypothetical protein
VNDVPVSLEVLDEKGRVIINKSCSDVRRVGGILFPMAILQVRHAGSELVSARLVYSNPRFNVPLPDSALAPRFPLLRATLSGSDALVVTAGIAARKVQMSRGRVRLISLMGLAGTMAGFGVDVLVRADNEHVMMAIAGLGGVGGLIAGARMTRNYDAGKDVAMGVSDDHQERWAVTPHFALGPDPARGGKLRPMAGLRMTF